MDLGSKYEKILYIDFVYFLYYFSITYKNFQLLSLITLYLIKVFSLITKTLD